MCVQTILIYTPGDGTDQICSNDELALNIKCKYNGLSRDHNHLSGFLHWILLAEAVQEQL